MRINSLLSCRRFALASTVIFGLVASSGAQLVANGGFEVDPVGTSVVALTATVDVGTFSGWRLYTVGDPAAPFTATIVTNASEGSQAIQLDMSDLTIGADYGLDRDVSHIPVLNADYTISFDAALISGSTLVEIIVAEFGADGEFLGQQRVFSVNVEDSDYTNFALDWTPLSGDSVSSINISFKPKQSPSGTSSSILLDNVQLVREDLPADGLYTSAQSFNGTDDVVSTSVFHWYTATAGQVDGPWLPLEGRSMWTGNADWWKTQIKQMMMANIDILYVHLIPAYEDQRVRLFHALNQLRFEGYDVPKVAPFLDPMITWDNLPKVDVATAAGKDEFVDQYIRFFNQYYSFNQDAYADDYLARFDDQVVLDTWHVQNNLNNVSSLSRSDVSSRLLAEFGSSSPFTNDIYMVSTALSTELSFSDELAAQFSSQDYFRTDSHNGIDVAQVKGGYWDQNIRDPGDILPRDGGSHYTTAWSNVNSDSSIDRVYIESFNEYDEGSGIYAADPTNSPYIAASNTSGNTDVWSSTDDPYEYIRTTAAGAAAFNDVLANDAQIIWNDFPDTMYIGETQVVTVVVRNAGDNSWTDTAGYQFGDKAGVGAVFGADRYLLDDNADEIPVYGGIFRGRPKAFQITLVAPVTPGTYETHWGMVQDGGAGWFGEDFAKTITVNDPFDILVDIQPESTVEGYNVLSWTSATGLQYAVQWSSDLVTDPFVEIEAGIVWPQSSYTDLTVRAGSAGFYQVDVAPLEIEPEVGVLNPGFEIEGSDERDPAYWTVTNPWTVWRSAETSAGHGNWILLLGDVENNWHWAAQALPVVVGAEYTASVEFKGLLQASERGYIILQWLDSAGYNISSEQTEFKMEDPDYMEWLWVTRSVTGTAPAGAVAVEIRVMAYMDGQADSALFADNVELTENN